MMIVELWKAIQDLRKAIADGDVKQKQLAIAELMIVGGMFWKELLVGPAMGAIEGETLTHLNEIFNWACAAIEDLGGTVPMMANGDVIEKIKIVLPILLRLAVKYLI